MSSYTVTITCDNGNGFDTSNLPVRISSIFVIGVGSFVGALLPIAAARTKRMHVPPLAFFITKYFGSGVIIATAFIHLLAPASEALGSPCLTGPITSYSWPQAIALITIFTMFFIELMASRFDVFGEHEHDIEAADPSLSVLTLHEKLPEQLQKRTSELNSHTSREISPPESSIMGTSIQKEDGLDAGEGSSHALCHTPTSIPGRADDFTYPPGGEDHLGHRRSHDDDSDHFAAQMTAIFILEFGVIFHSIFIGLTLAVTGDNFNILYIVLSFHQTFEGLGLGSRLATTKWPKKKSWMPWVLGSAFGLATPLAIAIGLGVHSSFTPGSQKTLIAQGIFDSISAGILIYTGLVELMAHEFMFNPEMRKSSIKMMLFAFGCMCIGAALMALLGKWA